MASVKAKILRKLVIYFMELGYIPSYREYVKLPDVPVKATHIKRLVGSWARVEKLIQRNFPDEYEEILGFAQEEEPVVTSQDIEEEDEEDKDE